MIDNGIITDSDSYLSESATPEDFERTHANGSPDGALWHDARPDLQLNLIFSAAPEEWYEDYAIAVLAKFRHDAQQWGKIEARWRSLYQSPQSLKSAVDAWLRQHPLETLARDIDTSETQPQSIEEKLQPIFDSSDPDIWYGALLLFTEIRSKQIQWSHAKAKAKQRGISPYDFEKAVDALIAHQKEEKQKTEVTPRKPLEAQSRDSALATLTEEWGIPIRECVKHSTENATWHLRLEDGKEINLGETKSLLNEAAVRVAIFDSTGKYIRHYGKKHQERWRELAQMIADIAITIDTPEMTGHGQAQALILAYLEMHQCRLDSDTPERDWENLAMANMPFVRNGLVHLHARHVWSAYARTMMPELDHRMILELLRLLGAYRVTIALHKAKTNTSRSVWALDTNVLLVAHCGNNDQKGDENSNKEEKSTNEALV